MLETTNDRGYWVPKDALMFFLLFGFWIIISIVVLDSNFLSNRNPEGLIYFFSVASVIELALIIISARRMQSEIFSPYIIFVLFLFLFSCGQFMMWVVGIHIPEELGSTRFIRYIDKNTLVKIQILSLEFLTAFHLGALLSYGFVKRRNTSARKLTIENSVLKKLALPVLIISGLVNIVYSIVWFRAAATVGYSALFDISMPSALKYISYMFIPSLFLNLIVNDFSKKAYKMLTVIFLIYALPLLITGDRGSWVYFLGVWLWCYYRYVPRNRISDEPNKKDKRKRIIRSVIVALVLIYVASIFTSMRDIGVSNYSLVGFDYKNLFLPFVRPIFEMGQSANVLGIIVQDKLYSTWSFGNTYVSALLGMILPRIRTLFGYPDFYIENWFSKDYLNMGNYGVGFSAFGEACLNGGVYFGWIYMLIYGFAIGYLTLIDFKLEKNQYKRLFIILSSAVVLGPSVRASMDLFIRTYFWGVILILMIVSIIRRSRQ